jgi:hypothetical protein
MKKLHAVSKKVDGRIIGALALVSAIAFGCSNPEKKFCERQLEALKSQVGEIDQSDFVEKCTAEVEKDIERCKNTDEVRECYGESTDGDSTPCVRICEFTEAANKAANKSSKCGDIADRCMKVCKTDHDCRMDCVEAQKKCEGAD